MLNHLVEDSGGIELGGRLPCRSHPQGVLAWIAPFRGGDVLKARVAMAERRRVIVDIGDRAAVGLEADARQGGVRRVAVHERLDRGVGQLGEVVALPVAPVRVALDVVVAGLELDVGELAHDLTVRHAD